jgi:hypothetical protein
MRATAVKVDQPRPDTSGPAAYMNKAAKRSIAMAAVAAARIAGVSAGDDHPTNQPGCLRHEFT